MALSKRTHKMNWTKASTIVRSRSNNSKRSPVNCKYLKSVRRVITLCGALLSEIFVRKLFEWKLKYKDMILKKCLKQKL